ncbi:hypothetical protein IAQ61_001007 [Plenodomus lingam]|uniref:Solute carrier family 40 member n=1 Tax=Leptosphaeria maculans (strain JN3 / isolate v23.1.3 / race Av1-4-5-6-7-8) TaxID=985895 RepID=E5A2K6_LEPMJ|nr:similar to solute carrier family 40 (iron-regulated transporter) [Plenodomus lingam JN3]KAH9880713.1 hypothetical protein IAQ61_001007 [Plenodomus lingam]CBX97802.1 similar to solute carrier family 40 (iron-regulated transporter) [Plenodomus lingam JN3]
MATLSPRSSTTSAPPPLNNDPTSPQTSAKSTRKLVWRLYVSHTLSTFNARTFEFGAVIFLAAIFPGTLFFASCYALFRSAAAALLGSWIGNQVDRKDRLYIVRQSIVWQRLSVATSCFILVLMLRDGAEKSYLMYTLFTASVVLACFEKLAFVANTVAVERDWIIVVSDSLGIDRQELNSAMRRIDLVCKLIAPVGIGLLDGYSTRVAIWVVFGQNALSVLIEYFAIAQVYTAVPELQRAKQQETGCRSHSETPTEDQNVSALPKHHTTSLSPYLTYIQNPAFLASFSLSLLYLTVLSFSGQMTTYLLTLGYTSTSISLMRLVSVVLEVSATCAAPWLMSRIGAVRSGLWFINEQVASLALAIGLFSSAGAGSGTDAVTMNTKIAGAVLVAGVCLSRLGLWGFDLSVQFLVQEDAPPSSRGSFSAIEMSLQNLFELLSFATTMVWYRPQDFKIPVYISAGAVALSAVCFAGFVRQKRGHLLHTDRCLQRMRKGRKGYKALTLPTIEEEVEMDDGPQSSARH